MSLNLACSIISINLLTEPRIFSLVESSNPKYDDIDRIFSGRLYSPFPSLCVSPSKKLFHWFLNNIPLVSNPPTPFIIIKGFPLEVSTTRFKSPMLFTKGKNPSPLFARSFKKLLFLKSGLGLACGSAFSIIFKPSEANFNKPKAPIILLEIKTTGFAAVARTFATGPFAVVSYWLRPDPKRKAGIASCKILNCLASNFG